ncbi:hypothetical protein [Sphingobacterium lactis]|uniref:hypothetical protein n=1 Tax=Sphingobacterium lactis TaxID=797291 RepID=UPI003DA5AE86
MRTFLTTIIYAILFSVVIYSCIAAVYLFQHGRLEMSFIQAPQSVAGFAYQIHVHSTSRLRIQLQHYPGTEVIVSRERVGDFKKWLG